jgi:hypothetical protein
MGNAALPWQSEGHLTIVASKRTLDLEYQDYHFPLWLAVEPFEQVPAIDPASLRRA